MRPVAAYQDLITGDAMCPACAKARVERAAVPGMELEQYGLHPLSKRALENLRSDIEEEYMLALEVIHGKCQMMYTSPEEFYEFPSGFQITVQELADAAVIECGECGYDVEDDGAGYVPIGRVPDAGGVPTRSETLDLIHDIEDMRERSSWLLALSQIGALKTTYDHE